MVNNILFLVGIMLFPWAVSAQVRRVFNYEGTYIHYLAQNNKTPNHFGAPGMTVILVVGTGRPEQVYEQDSLRRVLPRTADDYTCFYYFSAGSFPHGVSIDKVLEAFLGSISHEDFIDRNHVTLIWRSEGPMSCDTARSLRHIVSLRLDNYQLLCAGPDSGSLRPEGVFRLHTLHATSRRYPVPGWYDMDIARSRQEKQEMERCTTRISNTLFFHLTVGRQLMPLQSEASFDTVTLVDFSKIRTLWTFEAGLFITNRIAIHASIAFTYSGKRKHEDDISWCGNSVTVSGSGYAGATIRPGIGLTAVPFSKRGLMVFTSATAGLMTIIAGGGSGTRTLGGGGTADLQMKKVVIPFYALEAGICSRISKNWALTGNARYTLAPMDSPLGSVSSMSHFSLSVGIGLYFPLNNCHHD